MFRASGLTSLSLPPSQAGGAATHEADGQGAGAKRKRASEGVAYDAYKKFRPSRVRNDTGEVRVPMGTVFFCS